MQRSVHHRNEREVVVGITNTGHDGAVAFVERGSAEGGTRLVERRVFAEALERPMQCKRATDVLGMHYAVHSIGRVLDVRGARLKFRTSWARSVASLYLSSGALANVPGYETRVAAEGYEATVQATAPMFAQELLSALEGNYEVDSPKVPEVRAIPHHLCHAANAVYTSPFEECLVLVIDGRGDTGSLSAYHFDGQRFRQLHRKASDPSLGVLYQKVTALCGFDPSRGEEWKVMGLAGYGVERPAVRAFFRDRIDVSKLRVRLSFERDWVERLGRLVPLRAKGQDPSVAADLAHNFQLSFEDAVIDIARQLYSTGLSPRLAYAGGCALNSSANGKILERTGFTALHVPSAPADDGNALGAALYETRIRVSSPYLGSEPDDVELERILSFGGIPYERIADPSARIAQMLAAGKIVGVMQGRAEFGPRALGNRSILADPRDPGMKDRINARVKFREQYRPLAPAVLHEHGPEWFEDYVDAPYMERALRFRESMKARVPAVVHVDGTGRLQSVTRARNPGLHGILSAFHGLTGVPVLVNTSLNVMGKPIVHSVQDAITVFMTTGLDALAIGPYVMSR